MLNKYVYIIQNELCNKDPLKTYIWLLLQLCLVKGDKRIELLCVLVQGTFVIYRSSVFCSAKNENYQKIMYNQNDTITIMCLLYLIRATKGIEET